MRSYWTVRFTGMPTIPILSGISLIIAFLVDKEDERSSAAPEEMSGLVGALAKALASRRPACHNSDDDDDSEDEDEEEEDDDDWDD